MNCKPRLLVGRNAGLVFTESPRWRQGYWWFIDIHGNAVKRVSIEGELETMLQLPFKPNGLGFMLDGSMVFSDALARELVRWDGERLAPLATLTAHTRFCLSDGICDAHNRVYYGDIGYNFLDPAAAPSDQCVICCRTVDGRAEPVATGLSFPNGIAISPDGKTMVVAETMGHRLTAYDIRPDGSLGERRLFAALADHVCPDGIAMDSEGAVWVANPAGSPNVLRVREGGLVVDQLELDTHVYALCLGGPERRDLLLCCSDSHDPAALAASPSATLRVVQVAVPGAGRP